MHKRTVYVTFDLFQGAGQFQLIPRVKHLTLNGEVVRYEVGEFRLPFGKTSTGVRLTVSLEDEEDLEKILIEVLVRAQNVQVYLDQLPERYRSAPKTAA